MDNAKLPKDRLTFDGNFCDIAQCREERWGKYCPDGACSQRKVWERLKAYEDNFCFTSIKDALPDKSGPCLCICCYRTGYGNRYYYLLCHYHEEPFEDVWGDARSAGFYCADSDGDCCYAVDDVAYWLMLPDLKEIIKTEE